TAPGTFFSSISFLKALVRRPSRAADMPPASGGAAASGAAESAVAAGDATCCAPARTGAYRATSAAIGNILDHERWSKLEIIGVPPAWAMDAAREPAVRRARPLRPPAPVRRRSGSPPR